MSGSDYVQEFLVASLDVVVLDRKLWYQETVVL